MGLANAPSGIEPESGSLPWNPRPTSEFSAAACRASTLWMASAAATSITSATQKPVALDPLVTRSGDSVFYDGHALEFVERSFNPRYESQKEARYEFRIEP